ncbi:MAG: molybdopterin cofactor-binding domain-containing protein, partial [Anaerolineales bacterium]|nr:molybdopterin cofactor-binding domain-containing protein [Anaerolineales bacterium]
VLGTTSAAGLYLGVRFGVPRIRLEAAQALDASGGPPSQIDAAPDAWFEIAPDNQVTLFLPKAEMGQGVHTALGQIAVEELEVSWDHLEVRHASTGRGVDDPVGTFGSNTVSSLYNPLREAAATLRELLRAEAARQLGISTEETTIENGIVYRADNRSTHRTYGELISSADDWQLPDEPPALKPPSSFTTIGRSKARVDLPDKVTGQAVYGFDVSVANMLYGAVARPETIDGRLERARPGLAPEQPGVTNVVIENDFAGVVAKSRREAYQALNALELAWEPGKRWQQEDIEALVTVGEGRGAVIQREGNTAPMLEIESAMEAEYHTPMAYHAHLEPLAAVADVRDDLVEIWAATQGPVRLKSAVAETLGRDEQEIVVHPMLLGGGFGRKIDESVAVEAARLSKAAGRPVQVGLNRTEDFRTGFIRPPTHHLLRAVLDESGKIQALEHQQASGEVALPFIPPLFGEILGTDFGAWRGATIHYGIPNKETTAWVNQLPVPTGWWRGLGLLPNSFAIESFMDELAYTAKIDPLEFRLMHLPDDERGPRLRRVLEMAAEKGGWGESLPPGSGRGIACISDVGTLVAEVAEVTIDGDRITVNRVSAAVDPGLIINPDGVKAQTQGAITMGLSSTLLEEVTIEEGVLVRGNFDRYPLLRNSEAPAIDVGLVQSGTTPSGVGEPPIGPISAAVANAVFAASGQRLRRLPLKLG